MKKLKGRLSFVFFYTIIFIFSGDSFAQTNYTMRVANCTRVNSNIIEFDVYIKSNGLNFILTSYQCTFSFNQSIINNGNLNFSYIPGTSQLIELLPLNATGVLNYNGVFFLTFASLSPPNMDIITSLEKKVGRFRLANSNSFSGDITNIVWGVNGNLATILTGLGFSDITNKFSHINLSGTATFPFQIFIEDGWNLVSIPGFHPVNQNVNTWWQSRDPFTNVYNGNFQAVTNLEPGRGYWLKHTGNRLYNTGDEWPSEGIFYSPNYIINAHSGWNLIGIFNYDLPVSAITTIPANLQTGFVFKFVPGVGYSHANILSPGKGYLIYLNNSGKIILPDSGFTFTSKVIPHSNDDWGKIIITDSRERSYTLYTAKGGSIHDEYILPPAPGFEIFDIRFNTGKFAEDISTGVHTIELNGIVYPVKVKVENTGIKLQDETGRVINKRLKPGEEIIIGSELNNKLLVSNDEIPGEYTLKQNYPNPFNPFTTIEFSVPEEVNNVELTIYNALGEKITELVNSQLLPGYYSYKWNAENTASGLYIYELRVESSAGGFYSTKKMILLK